MRFLPKLELVDNWRSWHRMASMRMLALMSAFVAFLIANPTFLFSPIMFMPEEQRIPLALAAMVLIFVLVGATRLLKKKDKPDGTSPDAKADADIAASEATGP